MENAERFRSIASRLVEASDDHYCATRFMTLCEELADMIRSAEEHESDGMEIIKGIVQIVRDDARKTAPSSNGSG